LTGFVVAGDAGRVEAELDASALLIISLAHEEIVVAYDDDPKKSRIPIVYDDVRCRYRRKMRYDAVYMYGE